MPRKRKSWRDGQCFYVSVADWPHGAAKPLRFALVAGPFRTHSEALGLVDRASRTAEQVDPWSCFCAFGTVLMKDGRKDGRLNPQLGIEVSS